MALNTTRQAFLIRMTDGKRMLDIDTAGLTWTLRLNKAGSIDVDIRIGADGVNFAGIREYTKPKKYGIALAIGHKILEAGHITGRTFSDDGASVSVTAVGLWTYLEWIKVFSKDFDRSLGDPRTDVVAFGGMNLAGIGRHLIRGAVENPYEAGTIPPILTPSQDDAGTDSRTYYGKDFGNVAQRLTELTAVAGGPDMSFIPEFADATEQFIRWRHVSGTPTAPLLMQAGEPHIFDLTVSRSLVTAAGIDEDGTAIATRIWTRATGDGAGIATGVNTLLTQAGYPLLEADATVDTADQAALTSYNDQAILDASTTMATWSLAVRLEDPTSIEPGDFANVYTKGHRSVADGIHLVRIVGMDGDHGDAVKLSIQPMLTDWAHFDPMKIQRRYIEPDPARLAAETAAAQTEISSFGSMGGGGGGGKIGTIADPWGEPGAVRIILEGSDIPAEETAGHLDTYTPTPTDRVLLIPAGDAGRLVIVGRINGDWLAPAPDLAPGKVVNRSLQATEQENVNIVFPAYTVRRPGDQTSVWDGVRETAQGWEFYESGNYEIETQFSLNTGAGETVGNEAPYGAFFLLVQYPPTGAATEYSTAETYFNPTSLYNTATSLKIAVPVAGSPTTYYFKRQFYSNGFARVQPAFTSNFRTKGADIRPEASYFKVKLIQ